MFALTQNAKGWLHFSYGAPGQEETLKEDPCFSISVLSRLIINQGKLIRNDLQFETKEGSELENSRVVKLKKACGWEAQDRTAQYFNFLFELIISCDHHTGNKQSIYLQCGCNLS